MAHIYYLAVDNECLKDLVRNSSVNVRNLGF